MQSGGLYQGFSMHSRSLYLGFSMHTRGLFSSQEGNSYWGIVCIEENVGKRGMTEKDWRIYIESKRLIY